MWVESERKTYVDLVFPMMVEVFLSCQRCIDLITNYLQTFLGAYYDFLQLRLVACSDLEPWDTSTCPGKQGNATWILGTYEISDRFVGRSLSTNSSSSTLSWSVGNLRFRSANANLFSQTPWDCTAHSFFNDSRVRIVFANSRG